MFTTHPPYYAGFHRIREQSCLISFPAPIDNTASTCIDDLLPIVSALILFIFGSVDIYLLSRYHKPRPFALAFRGLPAYLLKILLTLIVATFYICEYIIDFGQDFPTYWKGDTAIPLKLLGALFSLPLIRLNHSRACRSSTPLLFYYLLTLSGNMVLLGARMLYFGFPSTLADITIFNVIFVLQIGIFSLECLGPKDYVSRSNKDFKVVPGSDGLIVSPYMTANILERLAFKWIGGLIKQGYKTPLTEEDLWPLPEQEQAAALSETLGRNWQHQRDKAEKASLAWAIVRSFGGDFLLGNFYKLCSDVLLFIQPQLLRRLLIFVNSYRTDHPEPTSTGTAIVVTLFVLSVVQIALVQQYGQKCFETGMRIKSALVGQIYLKSLKLSNDERAARPSGDITNLQTTDANRLQHLCTWGADIWSALFQATLAFGSLYALLGWSMFAGVAVMLAVIPLNTMLIRRQTKMRTEQSKSKDSRTRLMTEILTNIKMVKLYGWENAFSARLSHIRNDLELRMLRNIGILDSFVFFLYAFMPFAVSFTTFAVFSLTSREPLTPQIIFPAIALFQLLQNPLGVYPMVLDAWSQAFVSLKRLQSFFEAAELQEDATYRTVATYIQQGTVLVDIAQGTFGWSANTSKAMLTNITMRVSKGQLTAIIGRVSSGKSSLLAAILGEMNKVSGQVSLLGTVAYVSQSPWLQSTTVKKNILFGHRFNKDFYEAVIDACALREDLAVLAHGDETEIGERGVTLSGGQRARISLARAVYSRADTILLDDSLSAVDAHVGARLFQHVIGPQGLLADKARIMCTNALSILSHCDQIIMLADGRIIDRKDANTASAVNSPIYCFTQELRQRSDDQATYEAFKVATGDGNLHSNDTLLAPEQVNKATRTATMISLDEERAETVTAARKSSFATESQLRGSVNWSIYKMYARANGLGAFLAYLVILILGQIVQVSSNIWLKMWSQHNEDNQEEPNLAFYLGIYSLLGIGFCLLDLHKQIAVLLLCVLRSAKALHDAMFSAVLRAPMQFFEASTVGTILNRFSGDVEMVDESLPNTCESLFELILNILITIAVVTYPLPLLALVIIPLCMIYSRLRAYYVATSTELQRLYMQTRSSILTSFNETLNGVATIRAYGHQNRFKACNESLIDRSMGVFHPKSICNRWLAVRLELLGAVLIFSCAQGAVIAVGKYGRIDAGLVGLMMSYALPISQSLNWFVRLSSDLETNIVSVERMKDYIDLKAEAPFETVDDRIPDNWPNRGSILFENYSTRYREGLDLVLKNVSFNIQPGQKIGVCGRTGAGKSSLTLALYRIIEKVSGTIFIDDIDISTIGLCDLRSALSIIPQDSQCFQGTLRENLDPENRASDEELWNALEHALMKDYVQAMDGQLEAKIDEAGSNLSAGQRQLMCLARALLRHSKILILDEATSATDHRSDQQVQEIIRSEFKDCTIITIAHRLDTIMDSDKILVMSNGELAEEGAPQDLIADRTSLFYALANEAGIVGGSRSSLISRPTSSVKLSEVNLGGES